MRRRRRGRRRGAGQRAWFRSGHWPRSLRSSCLLLVPVEPVEINAGAWYMRGVSSGTGLRWIGCVPVSGEIGAEVSLDPDSSRMSSFGDDANAIEAAEQAIRRFAAQALG